MRIGSFYAGCFFVLSNGCSGISHALTVEEVVRAAVFTHPSVRSQQALHEAALTDVRRAELQFWPTPSVQIEQVHSRQEDPSYGARAMAQTYRLQQPLWTGGRLSAALDKSRANAQSAEESITDAHHQMALRAVQAWSEWYLASMRVKAQEKSAQTHQRLLQMVQRRVDEGASAASELSLTRSRLDQAQAQLQAYETQQKVARLKLGQLMGKALPATDVPTLADDPPLCAAEGLYERVTAASAALRKISAQQEALQHELKERRGELSPELNLRVEHQKSPTAYGADTVSNDRIYIVMTSQFGAGLSNFSVLEGVRKRQAALQAEYESVQRNVLEVAQSEQEQMSAAAARLPHLRNALASSEQTAAAWDRQFLAGRRSWVEVMNAARETAQAEIELADTLAARSASQWRMSVYCGDLPSLLERAEVQGVQP